MHVIQLSCVGDRHEGLLLVQLDAIPTVRLVLLLNNEALTGDGLREEEWTTISNL